ncbi:hypothetical protein SBADM41S_09146 [Streptomyces badius]
MLENSLRVALGRGDRFIGEEHLLLALTAKPGSVADVLAEHGATVTRPCGARCTAPRRRARGPGARPGRVERRSAIYRGWREVKGACAPAEVSTIAKIDQDIGIVPSV